MTYLVRNQVERLIPIFFFLVLETAFIHVCLNNIYNFHSVVVTFIHWNNTDLKSACK